MNWTKISTQIRARRPGPAGRFLGALTLTLLALLSTPALLNAQEVRAKVEPEEVRPGDVFNYSISAQIAGNEMINIDGDPRFDASFEVNGRSNSPGLMIRNGRSTRSLTRTYRLRATKEGEFEITAPSVIFGDKKVTPEPVSIRVTPDAPAQRSAPTQQPGQRRRPGDPFGSQQPFDARPDSPPDEKQLFVSHKLQPTDRPYVGQQITLSYWLFSDAFRLNISPQPPDEPSLDEFWIEDLSREYAGQRQSTQVEGRHMVQTNLRAYALFPLQAGSVEIEPLELDVATGGMLRAQNQLRLKSDPIQVEVRPLPPNAPDGFAEGNVGQWELEVTTNKIQARMGEPITVRVRARGTGQADRLTLPKLPAIPDTRLAGEEQKTQNKVKEGLVGGESVIEYTLVAEKEGEITIPGVEFVYFDPETEGYETSRSQPIEVKIVGGELAPPQPIAEEDGPSLEDKPREENLLENLLTRLPNSRDEVQEEAAPARPLSQRPLYWGALLLPLLGLLGLLIEAPIRRRTARSAPRHRRQDAYKKALSLLSATPNRSTRELLESIRNAVLIYATEVVQLAAGSVSPDTLAAHLIARGVDKAPAEGLAEVLAKVNSLRYAPAQREAEAAEAAEAASALRQACERHLKSLEEARKKGAWRATAIALIGGVMSIFLLLNASLSPQIAWADSAPNLDDTLVTRAITAQKKARVTMQDPERSQQARESWLEAAKLWEEAAESAPDNADYLFNLSLAYAHTADWGPARLTIERAALLAPTDRSIRAAREQIQRISHLQQLQTARDSVGDTTRSTTEGLFWWHLATSIPENLFPALFVALLWLALGVGLTRRFYPAARPRHTTAAAWFVGSALFICALTWAIRHQVISHTQPAVLLTEELKLRDGPSQHAGLADVHTLLLPGCLVPTSAQKDGWVQLNLSNDNQAWVRAEDLGFVTKD